MFPHTVTVYTIQEDPVTFEQTESITVLRGVFCDSAKAVNVRESGMVGADAVTLYIPFSTPAIDGETRKEKTYAPPVAYRNALEKTGLWTLDPENTFFVKGEVVIPGQSFQFINSHYNDVYEITSVDPKDFGGDMAHWEVGGK